MRRKPDDRLTGPLSGAMAGGCGMVGMLCALILFVMPVEAQEAPAHGLMWNRTGLPLVFPLTVRTLPDRDVYLTLTEAQTGAPALAAFIEAGRFFRVLAPPGTYHARFVTGDDWQDETALFDEGEAALQIDLPQPLVFEVLGADTKTGYLVDLTQSGEEGQISASVTAQNLCQGMAMTRAPRPQAPFDDVDGYGTRIPDAGELIHHPEARFDPERLTGRDDPVRPRDHAPYFSSPRFDVRDRPC